MGSSVVISHAPLLDYRRDAVTLARDFGTPAYEARADVRAINALVEENLRQLDERTAFTARLAGKKVIVKPNLVTVYAGMGLVERDYPESTDPRVLDGLVRFLKRYTSEIAIVESSGRGVPTRGSFHVAGLDRLARHHNLELIALEEQPCDYYQLPRAAVQKEVYLPRILREVVEGRAFYISVPKMKTNLYTGVTLGFKNSMGVLPYNLRQRNHHAALDQKLVDLLHLFRPDLTLIDGIVGGEGNCPAPVDPVDSRVLISGNNSVETDRVATRLMGFDPDQIPLMRLADAGGWGDPAVEVTGEQSVTPFRPADPSLFGERFHAQFPGVLVLVGRSNVGALPDEPDFADLQRMEMACRGGCLSSTRFGFEMLLREGQPAASIRLAVILGNGSERGGQTGYFDRAGRFYTSEEIRKLPLKKAALGRCTRALAGLADAQVDGCMPYPNAPHMALHRLTGTRCATMGFKNRHLLPLLLTTLGCNAARKRLLRAGQRLDCERPFSPDLVSPPLSEAEESLPFIRRELPALTPAEIRALCAEEDRAMLATFR